MADDMTFTLSLSDLERLAAENAAANRVDRQTTNTTGPSCMVTVVQPGKVSSEYCAVEVGSTITQLLNKLGISSDNAFFKIKTDGIPGTSRTDNGSVSFKEGNHTLFVTRKTEGGNR